MSHQAVTWAVAQTTGTITRKAVLMGLANCHNHHTGRCFPLISRLAKELDCSERTVNRALADLEGFGFIERRHTRNGTQQGVTHYRLAMDNLSSQTDNLSSQTDSLSVSNETDLQEVEQQEETLLPDEPAIEELEPVPSPRPRDELWDALVDSLKNEPETSSERGRWNAALKQLREAGATPREIKTRSEAYRRRYPDAALTPTALASNWGALRTRDPMASTYEKARAAGYT